MASVTAGGCDIEITSGSDGIEPGAYPSVFRAIRSKTLRCTLGATPLSTQSRWTLRGSHR